MNEEVERKLSAAWMTPEEAAAYLNVTVRVIRETVFPNVDTIKVGKHRRIGRASFEKYIKFNTKHGRQYMVAVR